MHEQSRLRSLLRARPSGELTPGAPRLTLGAAVSRFWPYLRVYRRAVIAVLALVLLAPLLETATLWMYKLVVDEVVVPHDLSKLLSGLADGLTYVFRIVLFGAALFVLAWQLALAALHHGA